MPEKIDSLSLLLRSFLVFLTGLFFFACANIVSPEGGPRDEIPPRVVRSNPENLSPNFKGEEIRIYFDEFIQLKEADQKLLVSPPMNKPPEIKVKGRSVIIEIKDTLRANTTYNFFLDDAIRDITESNPIPNFQFVVSTGAFVDSLSIRGKVSDAFSLDPAKGVYVMLYDKFYDSIPYLERPVFLSRTNTEGFFEITNIREGGFKIFALEDLNSNFLFDLPNERIAFLDSLIVPVFIEPLSEHDSTGVDSDPSPSEVSPETEKSREEGQLITLATQRIEASPEDSLAEIGLFSAYHLRMFREADTVQRVVSSAITRDGQLNLVFRVPFKEIDLRDLSDTLPSEWFILEPTLKRDTLSVWMLPPIPDSLWIEVADSGVIIDTLKISAKIRKVRGRGASVQASPGLGIRPNTSRNNPLPFFKSLTFSAAAPLQSFDKSKISLMTSDSIAIDFSLYYSDDANRKLSLEDTLGQRGSFFAEILPGAFTDIYGTTNDTLNFAFSTTHAEDYGTVILNLEKIPGGNSCILQLVDKDYNTLEEKLIKAPGRFVYTNLLPGNYGFRLIHDLNDNGRWDTGNYIRKIQPEPVYLYRGVLQIRQNWESEISWNVKP